MGAMQESMHKIMAAKNSQQLESLVQVHRHMLHQHMSAM